MAISKQEVEEKLLAAQSAQEVAEVMAAAEHEVSAEEAAKLFKAAEARRAESELDLDEMEAVAGGTRGENGAEPYGPWGGRINWNLHGCAATVEEGSSCWGTDGGCTLMNIEYYNVDYSKKCPAWNGPHMWPMAVDHVAWCYKCGAQLHV